ncbi:MAG: T9SS type A sorting domain-containing protein [Bacteroidales bacterium]|nr:T9SS type A sorting domain-containing protein [Bacteroidales bacterium]MCF8351997.1 T9SS type A sorting domain-containing protein [Bacteroidales bacterium]MCF8377036.1 T9SS type A sorting domain-containing protein [Bacteroidales bacterium]MCF8400885.1 T9SS type A sorting domain-containing protein [Bacteroidales bacterium]
MIKRTATLLILIGIIGIINAQENWCPPGAEWHYSYNDFQVEGYIKISYIADSTLDGQQCKVLEKKKYWYNHEFQTYDTAVLGLEFTYEENDVVYYHRFDQFYILYDFNAETGDQWEVAGWETGTACDSTGMIKVDSIGEMFIGTEIYRKIYTSVVNDDHWYFTGGGIIDDIGSLGYMFPEPHYNCVVDIFEGGPLRCYYDDVTGLIQLSAEPCDEITEIAYIGSNKETITLYPNPANTEINIEISKAVSVNKIRLLNNKGQLLKVVEPKENNTKVDIGDLPEGLYFIRVKYSDFRTETKKFVKKGKN